MSSLFLEVELSDEGNDGDELVTISLSWWLRYADDSLGLFTIADFRDSFLDCFNLLTIILHFRHRKITQLTMI